MVRQSCWGKIHKSNIIEDEQVALRYLGMSTTAINEKKVTMNLKKSKQVYGKVRERKEKGRMIYHNLNKIK